MFRSLNPGAIGVQVDSLEQGLELAKKYDFKGYHFSIEEAVDLGVPKVKELSASKGIRLSAWNFPVEFRKDKEAYEEGLSKLPALANAASELGVFRTSTYIMPCSDEMDYSENMDFHISRLKPVAEIFAEYNIYLGLEYVGPKTAWSSRKYEFIHTMKQMEELCNSLGENAGFLLDAWHWYNAHETIDDIKQLKKEQVVDVHINDAPDIPLDEQKDNKRGLPGETGVIDVAGFLKAIQSIGYDGSVMVEPFSEKIKQMETEDALSAVSQAFKEVWQKAGL